MNFCSHSHVSKNWYRRVEVKYHVLNYLLGGNYVKSNTTVQHLEEAHHLLSFVSSVKQSLTIHIWQDQNYRDMYQRHPDFESFCISFLKLLNLIYCNLRWKLLFTCCHFFFLWCLRPCYIWNSHSGMNSEHAIYLFPVWQLSGISFVVVHHD